MTLPQLRAKENVTLHMTMQPTASLYTALSN